MSIYKPNIGFGSLSDGIESPIMLNGCSIIIIDRGSEYKNTAVHQGTIHEIAIDALNIYDAFKAVDLINSCLSVVNGGPCFSLDDLAQNIQFENSGKVLQPSWTFHFFGDDDLYVACKMARDADKDLNLKSAVIKYHVSQDICFIHPMDLEPYHEIYDHQYVMSSQIKMGYSIVVLYSILEDLQLHVKASRENPSKKNGEWNADVVSDLKKRLSLRGIDPNKKIPWLSRQMHQRPFTSIIDSGDLCEWSDGEIVSDFNISKLYPVKRTRERVAFEPTSPVNGR